MLHIIAIRKVFQNFTNIRGFPHLKAPSPLADFAAFSACRFALSFPMNQSDVSIKILIGQFERKVRICMRKMQHNPQV